MRLLRCIKGVTRLDKMRNECIRESLGVAGVAGHMRKNALKCWHFGHVNMFTEVKIMR